MPDTITLTGIVATQPRVVQTAEGYSITSFRLASSQRRFDRAQSQWIDGETNWYNITTYRQLADNARTSVHKGDRLVLTGRLHLKEWKAGDKSGISADVDAESLGHNMFWGRSDFTPVPLKANGATPAGARSDAVPQSGEVLESEHEAVLAKARRDSADLAPTGQDWGTVAVPPAPQAEGDSTAGDPDKPF